MQIFDHTDIAQNTWVQLTDLPSLPSIVMLGARDDIRVGYGDSTPVNNWMHIEILGQSPFSFRVNDPSKLWVYSTNATAANREIYKAVYPLGSGIIPYC